MKKKSSTKKEISSKPIEVKKVERDGGVATYVYKNGLLLYSSWVRNK
jgi:hypothetical protein